MTQALIEVEHLKKYFSLKHGLFSKREVVHAVDDISFRIYENEIFGLVGESGCGKTTTGRLLLRLYEPDGGKVRYAGRNVFELNAKEMRKLRGQMQMIFQDPLASLNPRRTISTILSDALLIHKIVKKDEVQEKVSELLNMAGLNPAHAFLNRYPHELSSGQRQRIGIARALAVNPKFIVADEPVSALDVSIRAQILRFIKQLKKEHKLISCLFITHDLAVVRSICDRVAIMYLGKLCDVADVKDIFENPIHPYTKALLSATPIPNPRRSRARRIIILKGEVPPLTDPPTGCRFHTRCYCASSECAKMEPELRKVESNHYVACHRL